MKIEIIERNYDVGIRLRTLLEKKIEKLNRYFQDTAIARVVCASEGKRFKLELTIKNKGNIYRSETYGENMYENIDIVLPKIERQIIKYYSKNRDKFKKNAMDVQSFEFIEEAPQNSEKTIYKHKVFDLDPILVEDAKEYLENLEHDFYVFLNAETGKVNVLYNRKDGELGLIECRYWWLK